jgi:Tol biopolymer transport system component
MDFVWSSDGERIGYSGANDSTGHIISLDRSTETEFSNKGQNTEPMMDWSSDGSFLVGQSQVAGNRLRHRDHTLDREVRVPGALFDARQRKLAAPFS